AENAFSPGVGVSDFRGRSAVDIDAVEHCEHHVATVDQARVGLADFDVQLLPGILLVLAIRHREDGVDPRGVKSPGIEDGVAKLCESVCDASVKWPAGFGESQGSGCIDAHGQSLQIPRSPNQSLALKVYHGHPLWAVGGLSLRPIGLASINLTADARRP